LYFAGPTPQQQILGIDGEVGYNVSANGTATRIADRAAQDRRAEFYHHPLTILRAALEPAAKLSNPQTVGEERLVDITTASGVNCTLAIDSSSSLPTRVMTRTYHANLGDVVITTSFSSYQDAGGLMLPAKLTTKTDDFVTADILVSTQTLDAEIGDLAAPAAAATAALSVPPPATVSEEVIGPGVWLLAGQSHHSVLVEFADHLMLIEAPQSEARTLAVIAKARELRPDKPLTKLVTTHHHFDHTGGLRAAISEGLTVITHSGNRDFVEKMAQRPHSIQPDALAKNNKPVQVETVDDEVILRDATMTVHLYHVAGNPHSNTMLMAYFPQTRVVVEVDAYSPTSQVHPYAANLLENITRRKLNVARIVPLHGTMAPFSELTKVATSSSD
jgi:glyoxylase-like metal-dependent hydrolase (beta-lactamase superfamily II)